MNLFGFFANLFGYLLNYIYSFVNNYGIAIIIFSILLKIVMLPMSIKQQKTLKKSAKMQVKVKEIQEKYSNDSVRQSQELMDLYKREHMSPFSGCLGTIIQFIIIISMFYLVSSPLTYMRHVEPAIIDQYEAELKEQNGGNLRYKEIAIIKAKGSEDERISLNMNFLGLDLSNVPTQETGDWKNFIIPVLYVITSIVSMRIATNMNKKENKEKEPIVIESEEKTEEKALEKKEENKETEATEEMQKQMNLMMPFMTVSIALIAPLGLALYWLVNNLMIILERVVINMTYKEEEE